MFFIKIKWEGLYLKLAQTDFSRKQVNILKISHFLNACEEAFLDVRLITRFFLLKFFLIKKF